MKVIINADDFGLNSTVNSRTNELIRQGKITSATIIANAPCTDEAIELALSSSFASFGVHLNCTEGVALCRDTISEPFLDGNGNIMREKLGLLGNIDSSAKFIYREWTLQLERIIRSGINISHIDSHHHMHTRPWLFPILMKIQKKFGIARVRNTMNIYPKDFEISGSLKLKKKIWSSVMHCSGSKMTTFFTSYKFHEEIPQTRASDTVELMVHPGHPGFSDETRMLENNELQLRGFELINYNGL